MMLLAEFDPDILIIDTELPESSAVIHRLGQLCPNVQTLLCSDRYSRDEVIGALRQGVRAFVLNSQAPKHLIPALGALADHRPYWEDAIEPEVLDELLHSGALPPPAELTAREWQIIQMVAEGISLQQLAAALGTDRKSAEIWRTALRRKLGFRSRTDLVRYAGLERPASEPDGR
jgi:DNA-binding NarL/FixJ family response regulator